MTHFLAGIVVPKNIVKKGDSVVNDYIGDKIERYSESYVVEPHIDKTYNEIVEEFRKNVKEAKEKYKADPEKYKFYKSSVEYDENETDTKKIKAWYTDWSGTTLYDKKNNALTTWNKDSWYDWWRVGGRWDGVMTKNKQSSDNGFNFDSRHESVKNNSLLVKDVKKKVNSEAKKIKIKIDAIKEVIKSTKDMFGGFPIWGVEHVRDTIKIKDRKTNIERETTVGAEVTDIVRNYLLNYHFDMTGFVGKIVDYDGNTTQFTDFGWFGYSESKMDAEQTVKKYVEFVNSLNDDDYLVYLDCHV